MTLKTEVNPKDFTVGVIIARFQVDELHPEHIALLNIVTNNHKKVIAFLGVPRKEGTRKNPLNFAARKAMIQETHPDVVCLPLLDMREDSVWSKKLDETVSLPFGNQTFLLYGSRDSFIPHYKGKHKVAELIPDVYYSGTEVRHRVSKEIGVTREWRAGVIHATFDRFAVTYPTVDIAVYNDEGKILLAQKPNETKLRFIGGFVDRTDESYERAAKRELTEEAGGFESTPMEYVASGQIKDWRYESDSDGIMTTLFKCKYLFGRIEPNDDIELVKWVDKDTSVDDIVPEHRELWIKLLATFA